MDRPSITTRRPVHRTTLQRRRRNKLKRYLRLFPRDTAFQYLTGLPELRPVETNEQTRSIAQENVVVEVLSNQQSKEKNESVNRRTDNSCGINPRSICSETSPIRNTENFIDVEINDHFDEWNVENVDDIRGDGCVIQSLSQNDSTINEAQNAMRNVEADNRDVDEIETGITTDSDDDSDTENDGEIETGITPDSDDDSDTENDGNSDDNDIPVSSGEEHSTQQLLDNLSEEENFTFGLKIGQDWSQPMQMKNITKLEVFVNIVAMSIRGNFTYQDIQMLLKTMDSMLVDSTLPRTMKTFWSWLSRNDEAGTTRHLYCSICKSGLGKGSEPKEECACKACGPNKSNRSMSYFIEIKIAPQLRQIFSNAATVESLRYRFTREKRNANSIEDIYDGVQYKKKAEADEFLSNVDNFSLSIYTDGCSISNSSNVSAWPVQLQINELPPHARKKHTILAGIWVDIHPDLNFFLLPTITELTDLHNEGIVWTHPIDKRLIRSKFITLLCISDSVARPAILNMTLFNGKYGCTYCYAKGEHLPGKGVQRRYPFSNTIHCRTDADLRKDMNEAFEKDKKVRGVKGLSALYLLPEFDLHFGPDIDSMHNVYLGVAKQHTMLLLQGKSTDPWYAGSPKQISKINGRLLKLRPPSRISRKPREVGSMKNWKASEWRNWLLLYGLPCLEDIIHQCDLEHFMLLSRAIYILNMYSITVDELDEARLLLKQYVEKFEERFGIINMKFNIHLLNHLVETVENWGPLWAHTAFPYESWNRKIVNKVKSPNSRQLQIVTRYLLFRFISYIIHNEAIPEKTRNSIRSILSNGKKTRTLGSSTSESSKFQGVRVINRRRPCDWEAQVLQSSGFWPLTVTFFNGAVIHNINYRRRESNNRKITRFCDESAYCRSLDSYVQILEIVSFEHDNLEVHGLLAQKCSSLNNVFGASQFQDIEVSSDRIFINTERDVLVPSMIFSIANKLRAVHMPNIWETD